MHTWGCVEEFVTLDERGRSETLRAARIAEIKASKRGAAIPIGTWITILAITLGLLYQLLSSNSVSSITGAAIIMLVLLVFVGALHSLRLDSRDNAKEAAHVKALEDALKAPSPGAIGKATDKVCGLTVRD